MPARRFASNIAALYGAGGAAAATFALDMSLLTTGVDVDLGGVNQNGNVITAIFGANTDVLAQANQSPYRGYFRQNKSVMKLGSRGSETTQWIQGSTKVASGFGGLCVALALDGLNKVSCYMLTCGDATGYVVRRCTADDPGGTPVITATPLSGAGVARLEYNSLTGVLRVLKTDGTTVLGTYTDASPLPLGHYAIWNPGTNGAFANALGDVITTSGLQA